MYCTRCGTYNNDEVSNCGNCGEVMTRPRATEPSRPYTTPSSQPQSPYPGYQSTYTPDQTYQPYQSSYADQPLQRSGGASTRSIVAMVLSLLGLVSCGPLTGLPGAILGRTEINAIRDGKASPAGLIFAKIGFYVGIAVCVICCLGGIFWTLMAAVGVITD